MRSRFERPLPDAVKRLVVQQVHEPAEEQSLHPSIPALTPIVDSVSAAGFAAIRRAPLSALDRNIVSRGSCHLPTG
jgi:hypothetical protein